MNTETLISRQKYAKIPAKHRGLTLEHWKPYNQRSEAAGKLASEFVDTFPHRLVIDAPEGPRDLVGRGLAFVGSSGAGKTTLMALVLSELIVRYNASAMFIAYADFANLLAEQGSMEALARQGDVDAKERFWAIENIKRSIYTSQIVGFDDVGVEHQSGSGYVERTTERILRNRHRNGLPTLVSSNFRLTEWGGVYSKTLASFAFEAFLEVPMGGKDLRRRG